MPLPLMVWATITEGRSVSAWAFSTALEDLVEVVPVNLLRVPAEGGEGRGRCSSGR